MSEQLKLKRPKAFLLFFKSLAPFITHNRNKLLLYLSTISTGYASVVKKCTWFFICFSPSSNVQCISGQKFFFQSDRFISFCYNLSEVPSFIFPRPGCYCASQFPLSSFLADQNKWKITSFTKLREQHDSSGCNFCMTLKFVVCSIQHSHIPNRSSDEKQRHFFGSRSVLR